MRAAIVNCFDAYDRRAELLREALLADGHQALVLISNFRHTRKCRRDTCPIGWEMLPAQPYLWNYSPARIRSHIRFSQDALARVREIEPDLLWVMAPPNSLIKYAALYKGQRPGTRLVFDLMDLWPESMPAPGVSHTPPGRYWRGLRDRYIGLADAVVTEDSRHWETLLDHCGREKLHVLSLARESRLWRPGGRPPADRISLCHLGQIDRDVDYQAIGRLLRELDSPVELHVIGDGGQRALLRQTAEEAGAAPVFHGEVSSPKKKQRIFDTCHFGLNLMRRASPLGLTDKSAEYMAASLPVLNNVPGDTWAFIERYPVGLNYGGAERVTAAKLLALQSRREQVRAAYDTYFAERVFSMKLRDIIHGGL